MSLVKQALEPCNKEGDKTTRTQLYFMGTVHTHMVQSHYRQIDLSRAFTFLL